MIDVLTVAVLVGITAPAAPCDAPLPRAQAVPAPIVLKTRCGGFRLETDGRVNRLPPRWFAAHSSGTGRRYGADLQIVRNRAGRVTLLRRGRLVWRSTGLYPNTGGDVAFGPDAFAFGAYDRGVFLTDLKSPERLVLPGRALYPHAFFRSGRLIVSADRTITVLSPQGQLERRYAYRRRGGHSFDADGNRLLFITPLGRLATVSESGLRVGRRLGVDGFISFTPPGRLLIYGARLGQRTRSASVVAADGTRLPLAVAQAPFGERGAPAATPGTAPGPTKVERVVKGGTIGWLDRRELRGEAPPADARYLRGQSGPFEFARVLTPDPASHARIMLGVGILERFGSRPEQPSLCVYLLSDGGAGGGCNPLADPFPRGPLMTGQSVSNGGDQFSTISGASSDEVARVELFLASGARLARMSRSSWNFATAVPW